MAEHVAQHVEVASELLTSGLGDRGSGAHGLWQGAEADSGGGEIAELQRTQVAPEADAFTYAQVAGHEVVTVGEANLSAAEAVDVLKALRDVTNAMDGSQVDTGSRYLFITPTPKGVLDDYVGGLAALYRWRRAAGARRARADAARRDMHGRVGLTFPLRRRAGRGDLRVPGLHRVRGGCLIH